MTVFEPGRAIGLRNWGTMALVPEGRPSRTRLVVRGRIPRGPLAAGYALLMEIPHFIMERRMLLGIKERAERVERADGPPPRRTCALQVDEYLPVYDIADASAVEVHADVPTTWSALLEVDLMKWANRSP